MSIVNGSAGSRRLKSFPHPGPKTINKDGTLVNGDYFEMAEARVAQPTIVVPKGALINEITGGRGNTHVDYDLGGSERNGIPVGGILKMTRIEQFDV